MPRILIQSILGGHSPTSHFSRADQFLSSLAIDPAQTISQLDVHDTLFSLGSGLLRPVAAKPISNNQISNIPLWMKIDSQKGVYVYDSAGSAYTFPAEDQSIITNLSDGGSLSNSSGNGMEYYDNYMYFAKNTTIARYGPLNGVPIFDGDYWGSTLSKTALSNTSYPLTGYLGSGSFLAFPNHCMHQHSDGILYFIDVVNNQGYLHTIQTTKTSVEGDTDNGSTYQKLAFPFGVLPISIESYGNSLAISCVDGRFSGRSAKIAFWDTTSKNFNSMIWTEFPDTVITAMKNIDGVLYVVSGKPGSNTIGNNLQKGIRLSRFVGGYTFEEIAYFDYLGLPFPDAISGDSKRILIGSQTIFPKASPVVVSYGLQKGALGNGIFYTAGGSIASSFVSTLLIQQDSSLLKNSPIVGWSTGQSNNSSENGLDIQLKNENANNSIAYNSVWWSQIFKIGQPFKITKIRIPLAQPIAANMQLDFKIYTDDGKGTTYSLLQANNTNDPGKFNIVRRAGSASEVLNGQHNFWFAIEWSGTALCVAGLPISIEYALVDD